MNKDIKEILRRLNIITWNQDALASALIDGKHNIQITTVGGDKDIVTKPSLNEDCANK